MRPFKFPLETVLKLRRMKQEQALEKYAEAVNHCTQLRAGQLSATRRHSQLSNLVAENRKEKFSPTLQAAYYTAIQSAQSDIDDFDVRIEAADKQKEERMSEYLQTKRDTDILLKLREKRENEHRLEEFQREEKEIEDLVMSSRANKTKIF